MSLPTYAESGGLAMQGATSPTSVGAHTQTILQYATDANDP